MTRQEVFEELERLSKRALQYTADGKIEHAEDVLRRMVKVTTDFQVAVHHDER